MRDLAPRARFDALARLLQLDELALDAIRGSINALLPNLGELAAMWDDTLRSQHAKPVFGPMDADLRESLHSRLASFIFRTIGCVFDDDYCDYAESFAREKDVPPFLIGVALSVAYEFVARNLADKVEDKNRLAESLAAWNRLITALREFANT
ncbi:MAG: hypothetical protein IPP14_00890 [Planctomycetes bacterium]|nr:hypothetical protein [Planctomycetota bacterium]